MTKNEMVGMIGGKIEFPKADIEKILDEFVKVTQNTLKAGEKVSLTGLGNFILKERKARIGRNPKTGARVDVPAKKMVKFKPSKELIEIIQTPIPQ